MGSHKTHPAHEGLQRELRARSQSQHSLVFSVKLEASGDDVQVLLQVQWCVCVCTQLLSHVQLYVTL